MKITTPQCTKVGAFLLEWIAYHKLIGLYDIVILSNDREDGSNNMLDHLTNSDEITHLRNIIKSVDPAEFVQATGFMCVITTFTSNNPVTEFCKLQRGRRETLLHLRTLMAHAQTQPGPLLTILVFQHNLRLHPTA